MTGKEVEINSIWYNLFSFPLDLTEWLSIASILISPILIYYGKMPIMYFVIGIAIISLGIFISFWSKKSLLEGRHQIEYQFGGGHEEVSKVITDGPYRYTRHPWYMANTVQAVGVSIVWCPLMSPWVLFFGLIVLSMSVVRAKAEERWLASEFREYREYKTNVGSFFSR